MLHTFVQNGAFLRFCALLCVSVEIFTKISHQKGVKNGKFHANFTLQGSCSELYPLLRVTELWGCQRFVPTIPRGPNDQKKFDPDRNFQSRSKFLISLENFNLDVSISPQKIGPRWVARSKISFSIEIFNLDRNLEFF